MLKLSPAARRGIFAHLIDRSNLPPDECSGRIYEVVMYCCVACDSTFEDEDDALDCCAGLQSVLHCPVCYEQFTTAEPAVDCCLWKDLDAPTRWRIAALVEAEVPMLEAIQQQTGGAV